MKKLLTILFAIALGLNLSAQTACPPAQDANQDGVIGVDDLMDLLSHWGDTDFDFDGVYDSVDLCTDEGACNYLSNPTESCLYLDAIGACGGDCAEDTDGDGMCDVFYCPCQGEPTVTYQGHTYDLVAIGEQCWFAENCRFLPTVSPSNEGNLTDPHYYVKYYEGTDVEVAKATEHYETYGALYNWPAVMTEGICPSGWHIPSEIEWTQLSDFLGGLSVAGGKMKEVGYNHWNEPNTGATNSSGFTGLPGCHRWTEGFGSSTGHVGVFWTSSESDEINIYADYGEGSVRFMLYDWSASLHRAVNVQEAGHSARCIKDTE